MPEASPRPLLCRRRGCPACYQACPITAHDLSWTLSLSGASQPCLQPQAAAWQPYASWQLPPPSWGSLPAWDSELFHQVFPGDAILESFCQPPLCSTLPTASGSDATPPPSGCSLKEPTPSPCSSQSSLCQSLVVESPLHGTAGTAIQPDLAQGCAATKLSWKTAGERFPSLKVGVSAGGQCWSPGGGDSEPQHGRCRSVPLEPGGHSWQQGWKCSTSS